jgi:50S ribosomal protein L16 3-hydroxylase
MISSALTHLGDIPISRFMAEYWQKKPLLVRNALPQIPQLDPDTLAGFSLEEGVESRLIQEYPKKGKPLASKWHMEHGPFDERTFSRLPKTHWTLLVQAVDQLDARLHELLHRFRFVPNWRLDDIMVSYAVDGGGVGPHFDYYDVFLLQAIGRRHWRLGQKCSDQSPLRRDTPCKILTEFETTDEWTLEPGDMLYIPPQIAHWGVAEGECMTYSIGFRAPSIGEILLDYSQEVASIYSEDQRFGDAGRALSEHPGQITFADLTQAKTLLQQLLSDEEQLADWFGRFVTQPKRVSPVFDEDNPLPRLAPQVRSAYRPAADGKAHLYLNGEAFTTSLNLAQAICGYEPINPAVYDTTEQQLIAQLLAEHWLR